MEGTGQNKQKPAVTIDNTWYLEKSQRIVSWLAEIVDLVKSTEKLPIEFVERMNDYVCPALYDSTKLWADSCKGDWSPEDRDLIAENGFAGFEEVAVKYGLLDMTSKEREKQRLDLVARLQVEFVRQLTAYLTGDRVPNRTLIHGLLRTCEIKHPAVVELRDLTERVTNGEITWPEYVVRSRRQLVRLVEDFGVRAAGQSE